MVDAIRIDTATRLLSNIVKFALDSAVDAARRITPGRKQGNKMAQEGLMDIPLSAAPLKTKKKPDLRVTNDTKFHTKMEEEDMDKLKQQYKSSSNLVEGSQKGQDEGIKERDLLKNGRRIFIRSRL
ncbi:hypothetical protein L6164_022539 [Bauhinia variegata]|uniref:Uncharacterized protein n=1 Tax=Bauhinia variegata TaxID=167791 RepID=A0ACB9MFF9_BAUVA|nr:hypothetical protein L6164_022539 [Bauhinia variegata]